MPTTYMCEELTSEFANYWAKIQEDDGEGLEEIQLKTLNRWHDFRFNFGRSTDDYPLPLDFFVEIFDDHFFFSSLRQYTVVKLVNDTTANSGWVGRTKKKRRHVSSGPPEILIELKRLSKQLWTRERIQEFLDTLLHEMTHAFLMIYGALEGFSECYPYRRIVETEGLTGHGPYWIKVAAAVAMEADRALGGLWHKWDLGIANARLSEREALRKLHDRKGLDMTGEELVFID